MGAHASLSLSSMVRGYHKYKVVRVATLGERLLCQREDGNLHYLFSVAMVKNGYVVGHVPKKISTMCSLFYAIVEALFASLLGAEGINFW